ncbi:zinc ribbon domain-containing protein [Candidatus Bathyarchaeota archaeon]|nr:zinc ribbon domain-containing protein [Candidatus Bathyarchaeota archaeon]
MKKQSARTIHFTSSLVAGLLILLSKTLLIYREGRATVVLAQLPTQSYSFATYLTVEQRFISEAGFWASPTYTILAGIIGLTIIALLMSATLTSWSYDVATSVDTKRISSEPTSIARTDQSTKFCRMCGLTIPSDSKFCEGCGAMLSAPDTIGVSRNTFNTDTSSVSKGIERHRPVPTEGDVAVPIILLMAMFLLGFVPDMAFVPLQYVWRDALLVTLLRFLVIALVACTIAIFVRNDGRKYGISDTWVVVLLFAIIGLPLYSYQLHMLRKTMLSQS